MNSSKLARSAYLLIFILSFSYACSEPEPPIPDAPEAETLQIFCALDEPVVSSLEATGDSIIWYESINADSPAALDQLLQDGDIFYASQFVAGYESINRTPVEVSITTIEPLGDRFYENIILSYYKRFEFLSDLEVYSPNTIWKNIEGDEIDPTLVSAEGIYKVSIFMNGCWSSESTITIQKNSDLLLYYDMNENTDDLSINSFNATFNGSYIENPLIDGQMAVFNGVDNVINIPNRQILEADFPLAFSFMIIFDDLETNNGVIFTTDFAQDSHAGVWMTLSSTGKMSINYGNDNGIFSFSRKTFIGNSTIETDRLYSVVGQISSSGDMSIFLNGTKEEGSYSGSASEVAYTAAPPIIGAKDAIKGEAPWYFKGKMDEFSYWDRTLTLDEISELNVYSN